MPTSLIVFIQTKPTRRLQAAASKSTAFSKMAEKEDISSPPPY